MDEIIFNNELEKKIFEEVSKVEDPELNIALTELGLVYDIRAEEDGNAKIKMTLTSMGCPAGPYLKAEVTSAALRVEGVSEAEVEIVWTPKWDPRVMATEDAKMLLGIFD
jgi:metal-sulfur cluster biosynthetic enzyme